MSKNNADNPPQNITNVNDNNSNIIQKYFGKTAAVATVISYISTPEFYASSLPFYGIAGAFTVGVCTKMGKNIFDNVGASFGEGLGKTLGFLLFDRNRTYPEGEKTGEELMGKIGKITFGWSGVVAGIILGYSVSKNIVSECVLLKNLKHKIEQTPDIRNHYLDNSNDIQNVGWKNDGKTIHYYDAQKLEI